MVLIVNTTEDKVLTDRIKTLSMDKGIEVQIIEAGDMKISHCIGCNYCWLKTPGECSIKDDYEQILRRIIKAEQLWVISDTALGFINHKGKNIYDRIIPIATMNLKFKHREMRHELRYGNKTDIGLIYKGEADRDYLKKWNVRAAINFDSKSLGVYSEEQIKEAVECMS